MKIGHFATLRPYSIFGHELAVTALVESSAHHYTAAPGWKWNDRDTKSLILFCSLGGGCLVVAIIICIVANLRVAPGLLSPRFLSPRTDITDSALETLKSEKDSIPRLMQRHKVRQGLVIFIGLSPFILNFAVGTYAENVVVVMVLMHNLCMVLLPSLYFALWWDAQPSARHSCIQFYKAVWKRATHHFFYKIFRGTILGLPLFFLMLFGYLANNCRTAKWLLCVHNFERGLEANGLKRRSLQFRCWGLIYFTFINPLYEEFFWRVFLHRELGTSRMKILQDADATSASSCPVSPPMSPKSDIEDANKQPTMSLNTRVRSTLGVQISPRTRRDLMDLVPFEEDLDETQTFNMDSKGAGHDFIERIQEGLFCYGIAFSFWKKDPENTSMRYAIWQSIGLRWGVSIMYAAYHLWPIKIIFQTSGVASVVYPVCGFIFLACLGRGFLFLRECRSWGLVAATVVHMWVDAAFSAICLYEF